MGGPGAPLARGGGRTPLQETKGSLNTLGGGDAPRMGRWPKLGSSRTLLTAGLKIIKNVCMHVCIYHLTRMPKCARGENHS